MGRSIGEYRLVNPNQKERQVVTHSNSPELDIFLASVAVGNETREPAVYRIGILLLQALAEYGAGDHVVIRSPVAGEPDIRIMLGIDLSKAILNIADYPNLSEPIDPTEHPSP